MCAFLHALMLRQGGHTFGDILSSGEDRASFAVVTWHEKFWLASMRSGVHKSDFRLLGLAHAMVQNAMRPHTIRIHASIPGLLL